MSFFVTLLVKFFNNNLQELSKSIPGTNWGRISGRMAVGVPGETPS